MAQVVLVSTLALICKRIITASTEEPEEVIEATKVSCTCVKQKVSRFYK